MTTRMTQAVKFRNNNTSNSISRITCTVTCLTLMLLSVRLRTLRALNFAMFGVNVPDKPLLGSSNSTVLFASSHLTPYHSQWPMCGSIQLVLTVHSLPLAESWNSFRAFLSTGHDNGSSVRSNPCRKQSFNGAGYDLGKSVETKCSDKSIWLHPK